MKRELLNELERIRHESGGQLHAEIVLRYATDPTNPLHDYFEWDDTAAAEQWRLNQANTLIRVAVSVIDIDADTKVKTRTYVSLKADRKAGGGYRAVMDILTDEDLYEQMLNDALDEITALQHKYSKLRQLAPIFVAAEKIRKTAKKTGGKRRRPPSQPTA